MISQQDILALEQLMRALTAASGNLAAAMKNSGDHIKDAARVTHNSLHSMSHRQDTETVAINKRLAKASRSFSQLDDIIKEFTQNVDENGVRIADNSKKLKKIASAYEIARANLENQIDNTNRTWSDINTLLPKHLKQSLDGLRTGLNVKLNDFEDVLKFDEFVVAQQHFLKSFANNNKMFGKEQLDMIANVQKLGTGLNIDFIQQLPRKVQTAIRQYMAEAAKGPISDDIQDAILKQVEKSFNKLNGGAKIHADKAVQDMFDQFTSFTQAVQDTSTELKKLDKVTKTFGRHLRDSLINNLPGGVSNAINAGRSAGGNGPGGGGNGWGEGANEAAWGAIRLKLAEDIAKLIGKVAKGLFEEFIGTTLTEMKTGVEAERINALQMFMTTADLQKTYQDQKQIIMSTIGDYKTHNKVLEDTNMEYLKMTGFMGAAAAKMQAATINAARAGEGQRINADQEKELLIRNAKDLKLVAKYTNMTQEELANYSETLLSSTGAQETLSRLGNKERKVITDSIKARMLELTSMGLVGDEMKKFVEMDLHGPKTIEQGVSEEATISQIVAQYGGGLTPEERKTLISLAGVDRSEPQKEVFQNLILKLTDQMTRQGEIGKLRSQLDELQTGPNANSIASTNMQKALQQQMKVNLLPFDMMLKNLVPDVQDAFKIGLSHAGKIEANAYTPEVKEQIAREKLRLDREDANTMKFGEKVAEFAMAIKNMGNSPIGQAVVGSAGVLGNAATSALGMAAYARYAGGIRPGVNPPGGNPPPTNPAGNRWAVGAQKTGAFFNTPKGMGLLAAATALPSMIDAGRTLMADAQTPAEKEANRRAAYEEIGSSIGSLLGSWGGAAGAGALALGTGGAGALAAPMMTVGGGIAGGVVGSKIGDGVADLVDYFTKPNSPVNANQQNVSNTTSSTTTEMTAMDTQTVLQQQQIAAIESSNVLLGAKLDQMIKLLDDVNKSSLVSSTQLTNYVGLYSDVEKDKLDQQKLASFMDRSVAALGTAGGSAPHA